MPNPGTHESCLPLPQAELAHCDLVLNPPLLLGPGYMMIALFTMRPEAEFVVWDPAQGLLSRHSCAE